MVRYKNRLNIGRNGFSPHIDYENEYWSRVDKNGPIPDGFTTSCWIWNGSQNRDGYGQFYGKLDGNRLNMTAHRWAYLFTHGTIPDNKHIDHLCFNRLCENPDHLEAVDQIVNNRRSKHYQTNQKICKRGHPFNQENTGYSGYKRYCIKCYLLRSRSRYLANKGAGKSRRRTKYDHIYEELKDFII